ncbi:MAG TPA: hypothetical protein VFT63_00740 [bacterium]|nr:hypothetical protein [bacterium]
MRCLDRLEVQGFALIRDLEASIYEVRWNAADFVLHYVARALDDHRISEREMGNILALKRIYALDEGDLLALQRDAIAELLRVEMAMILADEDVNELEVMHQADLQRALGLGYDEYLQLTRESIRPLVDRILDDAKGHGEQQQNEIIRRLQALQRVFRVDRTTMTAIWPD